MPIPKELHASEQPFFTKREQAQYNNIFAHMIQRLRDRDLPFSINKRFDDTLLLPVVEEEIIFDLKEAGYAVTVQANLLLVDRPSSKRKKRTASDSSSSSALPPPPAYSEDKQPTCNKRHQEEESQHHY